MALPRSDGTATRASLAELMKSEEAAAGSKASFVNPYEPHFGGRERLSTESSRFNNCGLDPAPGREQVTDASLSAMFSVFSMYCADFARERSSVIKAGRRKSCRPARWIKLV